MNSLVEFVQTTASVWFLPPLLVILSSLKVVHSYLQAAEAEYQQDYPWSFKTVLSLVTGLLLIGPLALAIAVKAWQWRLSSSSKTSK